MLNVSLVSGDVTVLDIQQNETIVIFEDMESIFGPSLPADGIVGRLVYVTPRNACMPVNPPPDLPRSGVAWIALIARDNCDFALKVYNAQLRGYNVAIVHNSEGRDKIFNMPGDGSEITIPSVFVGYHNGITLGTEYNYKNTNVLINIDDGIPDIDYKVYLWPFAIVIGTCFCLMLVFMIAKWCRDIRRQRRSRLSKKHLKKIPIKKFKKGDYYDVCAICLDDYEEGEKMRVLPCSHAYHVKCIDPWLLKNKKTCPVCKRRVIPGQDAESDSESDEENSTASPTEATPLLGGQTRSSPSRRSTFDTSGLPEAVRGEVVPVQGSRSVEGEHDNESVNSDEGAVGGVVQESVQVVVENENSRNVNTNYGYSSEEEVSVVSNDKNKEKKRELNQVV
ncbi:E3 ubiquitin-protein ligase RNF13-like isoform X2 [Haliotis rubra]|uniref:E3 ubiquitin-protein ligase RNF13-like isoform X2 n=1 Tax=Haliotis rubra TaxID=36100 RepID=UPI001EE5547E|nr:E3 ubiquitin-protein ligase RNF13-like isoform X2 [Haliotis rubra]